MRFFRSNNHLLWVGVLLLVALCVYGVMYMVQKQNTAVQASSSPSASTDHSFEHHENDSSDAEKKVKFADPVDDAEQEPSYASDTNLIHTAERKQPQYVYLDVAKQDFLKDPYVGKIIIQLRPDVAPKTCANFAQLCEEKKYVNTPFHRVIKDFMLQGGDIVHQDGTGTYSIYGGEGSTFDDESFELKHDRPGVLSMANSGPNTNGSQFFITTRATPHLDGKHVVFGHIVHGLEFVHDIEREMTDANDSPIRKCYIMNCGMLEVESQNTQGTVIQEATPPNNSHTHTEQQLSLENHNYRTGADIVNAVGAGAGMDMSMGTGAQPFDTHPASLSSPQSITQQPPHSQQNNHAHGPLNQGNMPSTSHEPYPFSL